MGKFEECSAKKEYPNYKHQDYIAGILDKMDEKGEFSTLVSVPTGGGKTKIAADFCMKRLRQKGDKVLWIADRLELLKQSIERMKEMNRPRDITYQLLCSGMAEAAEKGSGKNQVQEAAQKVRDVDPETDILFASVQTIVRFEESGEEKFQQWLQEMSDGKLYIIYDEAHHIGAHEVQKFFGKLLGMGGQEGMIKRFGLIGLTATVYRMDSSVESFNKWFKNGWEEDSKDGGKDDWKNRLEKGKVVRSNSSYGESGEDEYINNRIEIVSVADLIKENILKEPELIRVDDFENGRPKDEVAYLADKIKRKYKEDNWGKTIVFVENTGTARELAEKLEESGVSCFEYTSKNANDNKTADRFREFKKPGGADMMISVDMVSEGFDVPDIETIYLYNKIQSQIRIRQRIGRVLRRAKDKKNSRVIWQKYPKGKAEGEKVRLEDIADKDVKENEKERRRDVAEYKKGGQVPAGIYLERLPKDLENEKETYQYLEFLEILDLFGTEPYIEGDDVNCYEIDKDRKIYFKKSEEKGYRQYYQMIMTDYYRELMYLKEGEYREFSQYAGVLGMNEKELMEYVKKTCFYMSNAKKKDTEGDIAKKRLTVPDGDIKVFYEYVVKNGEMPPHKTFLSKESEEGSGTYTGEREKAIIERHRVDSKKENLIEAMKERQKILYGGRQKWKEKKYAEILPYGEFEKFQHNEMESARYLMRLGASYGERTKGSCRDQYGEIAFIGKNKKGKYCNVDVCKRTTNEIAGKELCLIAEALVTVPNHIRVDKEDVGEYKNLLLKNYRNCFQVEKEPDQERLAQEFLMALGYSWDAEGDKNDNIIRMQCELFKDKPPRILQYAIYCRCYGKLAEKADYCKNGVLMHECQNEQALKDEHEKMLQSYGITKLDDDLHPVEDVLYDCRPYLKIMPNYQGIKPEFLCRMLNDILWLGDKQGKTLVDAFGSSGAVSMNINETLKMEQVYNDLGIMNEKLFKSLTEKGNELEKKVKEFIKLVTEPTGKEDEAKGFFKCYEGVLKAGKEKNEDYNYDFINDSFEKIRGKYWRKGNTNGTGEEDGQREKVRENYADMYKCLYSLEIDA